MSSPSLFHLSPLLQSTSTHFPLTPADIDFLVSFSQMWLILTRHTRLRSPKLPFLLPESNRHNDVITRASVDGKQFQTFGSPRLYVELSCGSLKLFGPLFQVVCPSGTRDEVWRSAAAGTRDAVKTCFGWMWAVRAYVMASDERCKREWGPWGMGYLRIDLAILSSHLQHPHELNLILPNQTKFIQTNPNQSHHIHQHGWRRTQRFLHQFVYPP